MDINTLIAQGAQPSTPMMSPMEAQARALSMQDLIQQSQFNKMKLQEQQSALSDQVALSQIRSIPGMVDPVSGGLSDQGLEEAKKVSPTLYETAIQRRMEWEKNNAELAKIKYSADESRIKTAESLDELFHNKIRAPSINAYNEALKNNSPEQAKVIAQKVYTENVNSLFSEGGLNEEQKKLVPLDFDPDRIARNMQSSPTYRKEQEAKQKEARAEKTPYMKELAAVYGEDSPEYKKLLQAHLSEGGEGGKVPSGYRLKKDGTLEYIPGGPADPVTKEGKLGNRESVFINRVMLSANEAAKDLNNVVHLPTTSSTGFFGGRQQSTSLMGAGKEALTNSLTSQEVQSYNVLSSGFQRSLAAIESAGLAPSGTLSHQMDSVIFKEGDTNLTKMQKLAQTRQIVEAGLETTLSNPKLPEKEARHIEEVLASIKKSVPFTQMDIINLQKEQEKNPDFTMADLMKSKKESAKQETHAELPDASKYDGKVATDTTSGIKYKSIGGQWVKQ